MKAMIFAAGLGTRLRPLTDHRPKALVEVGGHPMLERVILKLKAAGFSDITINIHHFGEQIIDYLQQHRNFGLDIHISDERDELLDTGGGILHARRFLDGNEPFLVHNVDILSDIDLHALYDAHIQHAADATLLVSERQTSRYLFFDKNESLNGWMNKATGEMRPPGVSFDSSAHHLYAFGGIHVLSPRLFRLMEEGGWQGKFSIIDFYLSICQTARINAYVAQNLRWFDIGKPETLAKAEQALLTDNNLTKTII